MSNTMIPFPARPSKSEADKKSRYGNRVVIKFVRGANNLSAFYEGDLAVTGSVGPVSFELQPLNEVYARLIEEFAKEASQALNGEDQTTIGDDVTELWVKYCDYAWQLHSLARRTVLTDGSRLTTAVTFINSHLFSLFRICRLLLADGMDQNDCTVTIDVNYGGLESVDNYDFHIPELTPKSSVSHLTRQDISKNLNYLASRPDMRAGELEDTRLALLINLLTTGTMLDLRTPHSVITPLADAFRAEPHSVNKLLSEAAMMLKENCIKSREELAEEDEF